MPPRGADGAIPDANDDDDDEEEGRRAVAKMKYARGALSSSVGDLVKNAALAHVRLHSAVMTVARSEDIRKALDAPRLALVASEAEARAVTRTARAVVRRTWHRPHGGPPIRMRGAVLMPSVLPLRKGTIRNYQELWGPNQA